MSTAEIVSIMGADPAGDIEQELTTVFNAVSDPASSSITTRCTYWSAGRFCCC